MKSPSERSVLLEQLKKTPIVQVACEKTGIGRATYYRWRKSSKKFADESDRALFEGVLLVNDLAESQLVTAIKDRNIGAIRLWLTTHHKAYAHKLEVTHKNDNDPLTKAQQQLIKDALALTSMAQRDSALTNDNEEL